MKLKNLFKNLLIISCLSVSINLFATNPPVARKIKLGFIPLTDCAPLVAAKELGLFAKYGVDVELSKEASWANIRD